MYTLLSSLAALLVLSATPAVPGYESFVSDYRSNGTFCSLHPPDWHLVELCLERMEEHAERKQDQDEDILS